MFELLRKLPLKILLSLPPVGGFSQLNFSSLDSLFSYAEKNSASIKISSQQSLLAKWTKIAAVANSINFRSPLSFSAIDNLLLPVNFIPNDIFGGPPGTFRQITLGQEYVTNFNFNPQIDIINPYNLARVKSAGINKELTEVNNLINKKALFESIAAAWFNCLALQEQVTVSEQSLGAADSVVKIISDKFNLGIAREQDLNNAKVNSLNVKDRLFQLKTSLEQQINNLKILCDIPSSAQLNIKKSEVVPRETSVSKPSSSLLFRSAVLQNEFAKSEMRANRMSMLPILSLFYYQGWQKNSNVGFSDANAAWIQNKYIGLRLTVPFPPEVNKLSQNYNNKVNYRIASLNAAHANLQNELGNRSMELDFEKATMSYDIIKQTVELKSRNYQKSLNQYREGILPVENLLNAFTDLLNVRINQASAVSALDFAAVKITINNSIK